MDSKTKSSIINALRLHSLRWKPRYEAKKARQVGPATFKCDICNVHVYEGTKDLNYPNLIKGKFEMDHNPECVPKEGFITGLEITSNRKSYKFDWNIFLERLFCEKDNFQGLCSDCHKLKTHRQG